MPRFGASYRGGHGMLGAMAAAPLAPSRADVASKFEDLLDDRVSRDDVDRWAAQWVAADDPGEVDPVVWWALDILSGIDLRDSPDGSYLHDDQQIRDWLKEFKRRSVPE